jgi:hypothetical protein
MRMFYPRPEEARHNLLGIFSSLIVSNRDSTRSLELLDDNRFVKVIPSVDLPVPVGLWNFGFELVLVACNYEFFSVVGVVIRTVHNENQLGNISSIVCFPFKIHDGPSKYMS